MKFFYFLGIFYFFLIRNIYSLDIQIDFRWHNKPITIPAKNLTTPAGKTIDITRLDFLLSQPQFTLASGQSVHSSQWHGYIHGEKPTPLGFQKLPSETITKLTLHLGPSDDLNHSDPNQYPAAHPLNPIHNNLHWSPQQGYIFFAIEGRLKQKDLAFAYHYGNSENRLDLKFEGPFLPSKSYLLTLHLDRLFPASFNISKQTSTHSRPNDPILPHFRTTLREAFTLTLTSNSNSPEQKIKANTTNTTGIPYSFTLPKNFPLPNLPSDYPLTRERISLGNKLFFDPILSKNNSISCSSCHIPNQAFSDPRKTSLGVEGEGTKRHSMSLVNLAWKHSRFRWDGTQPDLRSQVLHPIQDSIEMGENLTTLPNKLVKYEHYSELFDEAFGDKNITTERIAISLEQYLLSLTSFDSKFDRTAKGKETLSEEEKRGFQLFMTENDPRLGLRGADCFHCHSGAFFTNHRFNNNGLPPIANDVGLEYSTKRESDRYRFSTPSLRNIAITDPYMHDGRFSTLEEVVEHYSSGIYRSETLDPNIAKHPGNGLNLTEQEKSDLVSFLKTLTDPKFVKPTIQESLE